LRRFIPRLVLSLIALLAFLTFVVSALNVVGCCAIDCEKHPEACEANERRQSAAALTATGAAFVLAAATIGLVKLRRRMD
jgi:hypothetical protein